MLIRFMIKISLVVLLVLWGGMVLAFPNLSCVVVNGVQLTIPQVMVLTQIQGGQIPCGGYWLDVNTGTWGYEGGPPVGQLGDGYKNQGGGYYYHNEWTELDLGSDGNTSYFFDRDTGCSVVGGELSC